jgi:tetratricopeptide (TPR) repeat protein
MHDPVEKLKTYKKDKFIEYALEAIDQEIYKDAAQYLIESLEKSNPDFSKKICLLENISFFSHLAEDYAKALKYIDLAIDSDPKSVLNYFFKARIVMDTGELDNAYELYDQALDLAEEALEKDPDNYLLWLETAEVYILTDDYEMAGYSLENALFYSQNSPDYPAVLLKAADSYYEMGWLKECLETTDELKILDPDEPGSWIIQGLAFYNINIRKKALLNFKKALKKDPEFEDLTPMIRELTMSLDLNPERNLEERVFFSNAKPSCRGKIKWFDPNEGLGSIITPDNRLVILHFLSLKNETGFIEPGITLKFGILKHGPENQKELIAVNAEIIEEEEQARWYSGKIVSNNIKNGFSIIKSGRKKALLLHSLLSSKELKSLTKGMNLIFTAELTENINSGSVLTVKKVIFQST